MDIAMSTAPDIDLVIHVIKMRSRAECRRQRRGPLISIKTVRRIARSRLIEQRKVCCGHRAGGDRSRAIRLEAVARVGVVLIDAALRSVRADRITPMIVVGTALRG